jgi:ABC-type branched-subunit amino acid transport system substrate-binding protein
MPPIGKFTRSASLLIILSALALTLSACGTAGSQADGNKLEVGPGVTDTTIKVGFITRKASTAAGGGGFTTPAQGDVNAQVNALVEYVNKNGGLGGRKITSVLKEYDSSAASVQKENDYCTAFTQDEKVFAVVLLGQRELSSKTCYKDAKTLMLDAGSVAQSTTVYDSLKPFYWTPSFPALEPYSRAMMKALKDEGFIKASNKVGVVIETGGGYQSAYDTVIKPTLEADGVKSITTAAFDASSSSTLGTTAGAAVNNFKAAGVDRVIFLARGDAVGFFTSIGAPQLYKPRLAIGTYEAPQFAGDNPAYYPAEALEGAVGIGFLPAIDGIKSGFPRAGAEKKCFDIYKRADISFETRSNARTAMTFCDAVMFLKATIDKIGKDGIVNVYNIEEAAGGLGKTLQSAASLQADYQPGVYAPINAGRLLTYNKADGAFEYASSLELFPNP